MLALDVFSGYTDRIRFIHRITATYSACLTFHRLRDSLRRGRIAVRRRGSEWSVWSKGCQDCLPVRLDPSVEVVQVE